jgi:signal transduction histidine kinase
LDRGEIMSAYPSDHILHSPSLAEASAIEASATKSGFGGARQVLSAVHQKIITKEPVGPAARLSVSLIHDLRNPLAAISAGAELLMDMDLPSRESRRVVSNIYHASRRVEQLSRELIDLSRGSLESREVCKLVNVVQSALEQIADATELQNVCVSMAVPD